jgi:predicted HTH transcriptional regulator
MNPEAIAWLNQLAHLQLNDRQRLSLVYLRQHDSITNADYRRLSHVDTMMAGQELRGLVQANVVEQHGASRWTSYSLRLPHEPTEQAVLQADEDKILAYVREHGTISNAECRKLLDVALHRASYLLRKLASEGVLKREGDRRWSRYRLSEPNS